MLAAPAIESEKDIISRCQLGEGEAFEKILLKYQKRIFNFIKLMVRDAELAKDMTQETFTRAYAALNTFRIESDFSPWLYRIAYNICHDYIRSKARREEQTDQEAEDESDLWHTRLSKPEEVYQTSELRERLLSSLEKLKPIFREALILRHYEEFSYAEIAEILGVSVNAVRIRVLGARLEMQKLLKEFQNET